jgi:hypothetical protein
MESNDNKRTTREDLAATIFQLAADNEHLWALHLRLLRTESVIARGLAAYEESRELLGRFERYQARWRGPGRSHLLQDSPRGHIPTAVFVPVPAAPCRCYFCHV